MSNNIRNVIAAALLTSLALGTVAGNWPPAPGSHEEKLVAFARKNPGNGDNGKKWFQVNRLGCLSCHGPPGQGGSVGPDLKNVAGRYDREVLMQKVLSPRKGSAMPEDFARHLQPAEFADLIAFLEQLRD
jgi:mono/diheme cytochrome c family protein